VPRLRSTLGQFAPALIVAVAVVTVTVLVLWGPPHAATSGHPTSWQLIFNLGALVLFLSLIIAIIPVARHDIDSDNAFVAGLVATAALVPTTVTEIATVAAYIAVHPAKANMAPPWFIWVHNLALLIGTLAGLLAWIVWAAYYRHLVTPNDQNASVYAQLARRVGELRTAYEAHHVSASDVAATQAHETIREHLKFMDSELGLPNGRCGKCGLRWVLATGYISLWQRLHSAEQALILVETPDAVVRDALHDAQRLRSSNIPGAMDLVALLRHAATVLIPESNWYFGHMPLLHPPLPPSPVTTGTVQTTTVASVGDSEPAATGPVAMATQDLPQDATSPVVVATQELPQEIATTNGHASNGRGPVEAAERRQARSAIYEVRRIIDEFRDSRWDALVRRRNHLLEAAVFTRITAYGLLGLVILTHALISTIVAVTVFYLVGALVGLFKRLQSASASGLSVEDYGLSTALLIETAPFSGLAAIGGVLITGLVGVALSHPAGTTGAAATTDLGSIFDLTKNQFGIIVAAIFGLTPNLLTANLQKAADQYKTDLKSTGSSTRSQSGGT
jgi:hypothetical protein